VSSGEKQVLAHERPGTPAHTADVPGVVETVVEVIVPMEIPDRRLVVIDERLRHAERAVVLLDGLFVVGRSARRLDPVVERLVAIRVVLELVGEFARSRRVQRRKVPVVVTGTAVFSVGITFHCLTPSLLVGTEPHNQRS
jgi:hypothetical protein